MGEEVEVDQAQLADGRKRVMEALSHSAAGWSTTEGGVIVSFVTLFEVMSPDGQVRLALLGGQGDEGKEPVASWKLRGMLHEALHGTLEP